MGFFRKDRRSAARGILVALLAYAVAAAGLIGAATRTVHGLAGAGPAVICTLDGPGLAHDGAPGKDGGPQHCMLCTLPAGLAVPDGGTAGAAVAPPVAAAAPLRYDPHLPAYALDGWLRTRPPRAPPLNA